MLKLKVQPDGAPLHFQPKIVALAGFTGRNQEEVRSHIRELEESGIPPPAQWPVVYAVTPDCLTTDGKIEVLHEETSGEVEFVIILTAGKRYIAVGSDHTDRCGERLDIAIAKQLVRRVISQEIWRYEDVADHWDQLRMRSYLVESSGRRLYQEGRADLLLPVDQIVECVAARSSWPLEDAVIFGGTLPIIGGALVYGPRFEVELSDPVTSRSLRAAYDVCINGWLRR